MIATHFTNFTMIQLPTQIALASLIATCLLAVGAAAETDTRASAAAYRDFALQHRGDADAGKLLFEAKTAQCINCHRLTGMEKSGPNLDGIGQKYTRAELILHVLEPSAAIMPGYEQAILLLDDGRSLAGRFERATKLEVRLIDAAGDQTKFLRDQIEDIQFSPKSLMPDNLASLISKQDFADLIAYLESLKFEDKQGLGPGGVVVPIPRLAEPIRFVPHCPDVVFQNPVWCGAFPARPGELLVIEHQEAKVWRLVPEGEQARKELFVDLAAESHISPNQGVMCLALHPDFVNNGRYFLEHEVKEDGVVKTLVVERRATPDRLRDGGADSLRLLEVQQPAFNHNGGCIAFGPDGMLYAAFGDGGPQKDPEGYSQNITELKGSMVRVDVDHRTAARPYAIPADNPFWAAHRKNSAVRPETWAFGFREPWRFSFDPVTEDLWLGDVGQNKYEEVAIVRRGENHGWNVREGFAAFSAEYHRANADYADPLFAYEHGLGFSVTGGHVYRANPQSSFYGVYIFGDYNTRRVWGLRQAKDQPLEVRELGTAPGGIASFGLDDQGELLLVTYEGRIFRLDFSATEWVGRG